MQSSQLCIWQKAKLPFHLQLILLNHGGNGGLDEKANSPVLFDK